MPAFKVLSWLQLTFIVPVASPFRFTVTGRTQKDMTDSAAVTVIGCFSSLTLTRPVNRELKTKSPKWLLMAQGFAISGTGSHFIDWLREGIATRIIAVNDTKVPIHMVQGNAFLVSPGIFKLFVSMTTGDTGGS